MEVTSPVWRHMSLFYPTSKEEGSRTPTHSHQLQQNLFRVSYGTIYRWYCSPNHSSQFPPLSNRSLKKTRKHCCSFGSRRLPALLVCLLDSCIHLCFWHSAEYVQCSVNISIRLLSLELLSLGPSPWADETCTALDAVPRLLPPTSLAQMLGFSLKSSYAIRKSWLCVHNFKSSYRLKQ